MSEARERNKYMRLNYSAKWASSNNKVILKLALIKILAKCFFLCISFLSNGFVSYFTENRLRWHACRWCGENALKRTDDQWKSQVIDIRFQRKNRKHVKDAVQLSHRCEAFASRFWANARRWPQQRLKYFINCRERRKMEKREEAREETLPCCSENS